MPSRRFDPRDLPEDSVLSKVLRPRGAPITIEHDGRPLDAFEGEPLAIALLARGVDTLARSIKFHRPRGPACLRGNCEGCLTRVDGVPNWMACRVPAHPRARVESQNAFPSASIDVLRVTDWFFPKKFDHHHLMVQFGSTLNRTMQVFARRMAGLGTLPEHDGSAVPAESIDTDVLVVGAGAAGLAAAVAIARAGYRVLACEEENEAGGALLDDVGYVDAARKLTGPQFAAALVEQARAAGVDLRTNACASATFDNATLVISPDRALRVTARARVFANGTHELVGCFENNDLPGVYTARAAARALRYGVSVGERCVIVGNAWPSEVLAKALRDAGGHVEWFPNGTIAGVDGSGSVSRVHVTDGANEHRVKCDAIVVADEAVPAYELLGQAGIEIDPDADRSCFSPRVASDGSTERRDVFACGAVRSAMGRYGGVDVRDPLAAGGAVSDGLRTGARVVNALRDGSIAARHEVRA
jgi:sarcosine oxidase subunit alpha